MLIRLWFVLLLTNIAAAVSGLLLSWNFVFPVLTRYMDRILAFILMLIFAFVIYKIILFAYNLALMVSGWIVLRNKL